VAYPTAGNSALLLELIPSRLPEAAPSCKRHSRDVYGTFHSDWALRESSTTPSRRYRETYLGTATDRDCGDGRHNRHQQFHAVFPGDLINVKTTTIAAPTTLGRGTAVISGVSPKRNLQSELLRDRYGYGAALRFRCDAVIWSGQFCSRF